MTSIQNEIDEVLSALGLSGAAITATDLLGVVRLSGTVANCGQKAIAEEVVKQVTGVKEVINEIILINNQETTSSDDCTRAAIQNALKNHWLIPHQKIAVKVTNGNVSLDGMVRWEYQKTKILSIIRKINGVKNVTDKILIQSEIEDAIEAWAVQEALKSNWALDGSDIKAMVKESTVCLTGTVCSLVQQELAEDIAWKVKGVWNVENNLVIDY